MRTYAAKTSTNSDVTALDVANRGDEAAPDALKAYVHQLARSLASVINLLAPDVIVLGGGLSNIDMLYTAVPSTWSQWVFSDKHDTPCQEPAWRFQRCTGCGVALAHL